MDGKLNLDALKKTLHAAPEKSSSQQGIGDDSGSVVKRNQTASGSNGTSHSDTTTPKTGKKKDSSLNLVSLDTIKSTSVSQSASSSSPARHEDFKDSIKKTKKQSPDKLISLDTLKKFSTKKTNEKAEGSKGSKAPDTKKKIVDSSIANDVIQRSSPIFHHLTKESNKNWSKEKQEYENQKKKRYIKVSSVVSVLVLLVGTYVFLPSKQPSPDSTVLKVSVTGSTNTNSTNENTNTNMNDVTNDNNNISQIPDTSEYITGQIFLEMLQEKFAIDASLRYEMEVALELPLEIEIFDALYWGMRVAYIDLLIPTDIHAPLDSYVNTFALQEGIVSETSDLDRKLDQETMEKMFTALESQ